MPDAIDLKISKKLQRFLSRVEKLAAHEFGVEVGLSVCVHQLADKPENSRVTEFQYVSNLPREHMREAFRALVKKWDAGAGDIPPHLKS